MYQENFYPIRKNIFTHSLLEMSNHFSGENIDCFISYAWDYDETTPNQVKRLNNDLKIAGIKVLSDLSENNSLNNRISSFKKNIKTVKYVILVGSENLMKKYNSSQEYHIKDEIKMIEDRFKKEQKDQKKDTILVIALSDILSECEKYTPPFLRDRIIGKYSNKFETYTETTFAILKYLASEKIKPEIEKIIENYKEFISSIEFNKLISEKTSNPVMLYPMDCLLKNTYLKIFDSDQNLDLEHITNFKLYVKLQKNVFTKITTEPLEQKYEDLINTFQLAPAKIKIQGDLGMGKTTLCKTILYLWAKSKKLLDFKFVFFIQTSNLNESRYPALPNKVYTEIDIIVKECFFYGIDIIYQKLLKFNISEGRYKILWIIDEYDPINNNIPNHLKVVLNGIIDSTYTILTSRKHPKEFTSYYQITGFDQNVQIKYINFFFDSLHENTDLNIKTNLLHFLKNNPLIEQLSFIPIYLNFICNIWLNNFQITNQHNITLLYQKIFNCLIYKFIMKKSDTELENPIIEFYIYTILDPYISFISKMAFFAYKKNHDFFELKIFKDFAIQLNLPNISNEILLFLLKNILQIGIISQNGNNLKFTDPSLKIFFTAKYLTDPSKLENLYKMNEFNDFMKNKKYNKDDELLFIFISGLLHSLPNSNNKQTIQNIFWEKISSNNLISNKNLIFKQIEHVYLLMRCIKETDYRLILKKFKEIQPLISNLPKILQHLKGQQSREYKDMYLRIFNDPSYIKIIIFLGILNEVIEFIAHADQEHTNQDYTNSVLLHLLKSSNHECKQKILESVKKSLLKLSNIKCNLIGRYFALAIRDIPGNNKFLIDLLTSYNIHNIRSAFDIIIVQNLNDKKINEFLMEIITLSNPLLKRELISYNSFSMQPLVTNPFLNNLMEINILICECIDVLFLLWERNRDNMDDIMQYTVDFFVSLNCRFNITLSPEVKHKIYNTVESIRKTLDPDNTIIVLEKSQDPKSHGMELLLSYKSKNIYKFNSYELLTPNLNRNRLPILQQIEHELTSFITGSDSKTKEILFSCMFKNTPKLYI